MNRRIVLFLITAMAAVGIAVPTASASPTANTSYWTTNPAGCTSQAKSYTTDGYDAYGTVVAETTNNAGPCVSYVSVETKDHNENHTWWYGSNNGGVNSVAISSPGQYRVRSYHYVCRDGGNCSDSLWIYRDHYSGPGWAP